MNMKKLTALTLALICLSALVIGGTMAQVIDQGTAHNVITSNGVDIALVEQQIDGNGETVPYPSEPVGVMPSAVQSKIVKVRNENGADAWIRVKVEKTIKLAPGKSGEVDLDLIKLDIDTRNWKKVTEDGVDYYYYNKPLAKNETTEALFNTVTFDPQMGNLYQESTANVTVQVYAVQAANNGKTVFEAQGWPEAVAQK